jgi:hypothetical protein
MRGIGGFKEMCDGFFLFREIFRGVELKDFRQVMSESVCFVDVAACPCTEGRPNRWFQGKVGFRKEHNVNVATGKKGLQLECMLCQAVGIP